MSHWNYRVVESGGILRLIEVYYDDDDNIFAWTETAASGDTLVELGDTLALMELAIQKPVIQRKDLP